VKRRNLAVALAFMATLLVAAFAAASVSAATSSPKATQVAGKGWRLTNKNMRSQAVKKVGTGQFAPTPPTQPKFINSPTPQQKQDPGVNTKYGSHDRAIPGKQPHKAPSGQAPSGPGAPFIPHAASLPIHSATGVTTTKGLNAYNQDSTGGYIDTPPDQALAEGNGYVFEAVNNVFEIMNTNFGHVTNAEPMEQFWADAILTTGYCSVSDPKAHYDTITRKWYVTEVAYGPPGCAPGSAVFIAVSTTSDPLSIYNIYVMDTSFDGTTCGPDGCLADQPLLGMNRNALFISTNSYDWDSNAFNGTQLYIIDSTALAAGFVFPNIVYFDVGANIPTPEGADTCGTPGPFCWYSLQPGTSPNFSQVQSRNGTEFFMSALDWFGSVDNRIALWALTNTATISSFFPNMFINYAIANTQSYGFPFTDTPFFSPYAEQPSSGNTPFCDFFFGPFCEPGPIANNDDRMNEVKTIVPFDSHGNPLTAHNWGGLNTDALVADPIGHLHRRSAIAYFDLSATTWVDDSFGDCAAAHLLNGCFIAGAKVNGQGYVANWNNDVVFPAIGVNTAADENAAMVYTLTGNDHFPSVAISTITDKNPPADIKIALAGQDVLDDFAWYIFGEPRWGDYSAAVADGHTIYLASEYIQYQSCSDAEYFFDPTCGGTRSEFTNWGTGLVKVNL